MRRIGNPKTIVIITGAPGTGKSYWANSILDGFEGVHLLAYDAYKECYFDKYGFDSQEEKSRLNALALEDFYQAVDVAMKRGETLVVEYPFNQSHRQRLVDMIEENRYNGITLFLHGDMETLYRRGYRRDMAGNRHPGHLLSRYHKGVTPQPKSIDPEVQLSLEEFIESCGRKDYDIKIGKEIDVNVTDTDLLNQSREELMDAIAAMAQ